MLSGSQIRNISDVAAYRASEEGLVPLAVWAERDIPHLPFLGRYVPPGYRVATWDDIGDVVPRTGFYRSWDSTDEVWVECGGWGEGDFTDAIMSAAGAGCYWALVESGEFQTYARAYIQDDDANGEEAPSGSSLTCADCGTVHNDLEECDGPYCYECGNDLDYGQHEGDLCNSCAEEEQSDGDSDEEDDSDTF